MRRDAQPDSRRTRRQRAVVQARLDGRYGPEWWQILPAFAIVAAAVALPAATLAWLHSRLGVLGVVLGVAVLAALAAVAVRHRRAAARRAAGHYTAVELARLDEEALAVAAARMLRRDGWRVQTGQWDGQPRLLARDPEDRRLDVTFRPPEEAAVEEAPGRAALRAARPADAGGTTTRLVISHGTYRRADVLWASRQGGVHLMDRHQLDRWAQGTPLGVLLGVAPTVSDAA